MAGGAALTEDGKLAGGFVLRRARAGAEAFEWPVGVSAPALRNWLAGGTLTAPPGPVEIAEAGTASILTASRPLGVSMPAGAEATQVSHHVFYQDGIRAVCMANCDDPAPAPVPRARSRTRYTNPRSSYGSSSNANAELGKALGEAIAPLVEAMIFKGIPALFRGIGSLFSRKGKASASPSRKTAVQEPVRVPEKPKEPPTLTALNLEVTPKTAAPGESVTLTASATLSDPEAPKANISVAFKASPSTLVRFTAAPQAKTNASGIATISATLRRDHGVRVVKAGDSKAVKGKSDSAHSALDDEARAMADESDDSSKSNGASERDEKIEFGASATVVKSLSASASLVLSDKTKPECKFEAVDAPESVGAEPFTIKVRVSCTKVEGIPDVPLDGHQITLTVGPDGESRQTVTLRTDSDGYASASFQAGDSAKPLPAQSVGRIDASQYINAANPEVLEPLTKIAPIAVTGGPMLFAEATLVFEIGVPVVIVGGGAVAVIKLKMYFDDKKYKKGVADHKADERAASDPEKQVSRDTGKCAKVQHEKLQGEIDAECTQDVECRGPSNGELDDCDVLRQLLRNNQDSLRKRQRCLMARQRMRNQCFPNPRPENPNDRYESHLKASKDVLRGIGKCKDKIDLVRDRMGKLPCD